MSAFEPRRDEEAVRRAIDVLDEPGGSIRDAVLRRIGVRLPRELAQLHSLVWMKRASGVAAALFLTLFAMDFFVSEDSSQENSPLTESSASPPPEWIAFEESELGMYSQEGWIVSELLAGEGSE